MMTIATILAGLALALLLTGTMRRYALARQLFDQPNHRSSHTVATPRGGGIAILAAFLLVMFVFHLLSILEIWRPRPQLA
jgi:Fuc2NAc and GlcNAc transferase